MQKLAWRLCKLKPEESAKMTLYELDIVLEEGLEELHENVRMHTDLKVSILNARFSSRRGGGLYTMEDFLPKSMLHHNQGLCTPEQKNKKWLAAGNAMMDAADQYPEAKQRRGRRGVNR